MQQGIDALMYYEVYKIGDRKRVSARGDVVDFGRQYIDESWRLKNMGATLYKRYRIYDYPLL